MNWNRRVKISTSYVTNSSDGPLLKFYKKVNIKYIPGVGKSNKKNDRFLLPTAMINYDPDFNQIKIKF